MRLNRTVGVSILSAMFVVSAGTFSIAHAMAPAADPTTKPVKVKPIKLTVPWSKVADLSDDQKSQINAIHIETADKIKALEKAEDDDCMAILTDAQKKALAQTLEQEKADKKKPKK